MDWGYSLCLQTHTFFWDLFHLLPQEGGMTLYCKAAEDNVSVGDCPFAHYDRLVLEEKQLEYELKPTAPEDKPQWLVEYYQGKMPALRHRKECYVESSVIAEYLEYFFPEPSLSIDSNSAIQGEKAEAVLDGFFPAVAKFLKDTQDTEDTSSAVKAKLQQLEDHLAAFPAGSFLCGTEKFTLLDCRMVPMLYHLTTGIEGFKNGQPNTHQDFPKIHAYFSNCMARPSFQATVYPKETVLWGWGNART
jgi:glutathione S-transferase